jgi:hypothetical protein
MPSRHLQTFLTTYDRPAEAGIDHSYHEMIWRAMRAKRTKPLCDRPLAHTPSVPSLQLQALSVALTWLMIEALRTC